MRKDGVRADRVNHSRNSSTGKRGHNKRVRRLPLPDEAEPACKSGKQKQKANRKPYLIECRFKLNATWGKWLRWKAYADAESRDQALKSKANSHSFMQFRARDKA